MKVTSIAYTLSPKLSFQYKGSFVLILYKFKTNLFKRFTKSHIQLLSACDKRRKGLRQSIYYIVLEYAPLVTAPSKTLTLANI